MKTPARQTENPPAQLPSRRPRRRNGKIARLPEAAREIVNSMLLDGATHTAIIARLAEQGHHFTRYSLTRWFAGGYKDWLKEQGCREEMRHRFDFAAQLVNQKNADTLTEAGLRIATTRMYNFLLEFDPADLARAIPANPALYPRLLNSLCKITDGALKHHRYRDGQQRNSKHFSIPGLTADLQDPTTDFSSAAIDSNPEIPASAPLRADVR
jgi:hypothetical protein